MSSIPRHSWAGDVSAARSVPSTAGSCGGRVCQKSSGSCVNFGAWAGSTWGQKFRPPPVGTLALLAGDVTLRTITADQLEQSHVRYRSRSTQEEYAARRTRCAAHGGGG